MHNWEKEESESKISSSSSSSSSYTYRVNKSKPPKQKEKNKILKKGGKNRGKNYNHSTFIDLIISGLIGLQPSFHKKNRNKLVIDPLIPLKKWSYFCLDGVLYHNHIITIMWDETGGRYKRGKGFHIYVDGQLKLKLPNIQKVTVFLQ